MQGSSKGRWKTPSFYDQLNQRLKEGTLIVLCAISLFLLIALLTHSPADPGWSSTGAEELLHNAAGRTGAWFSDVLFSLCGWVAFLVPVAITYGGLLIYRKTESFDTTPSYRLWALRSSGFVLALIASCGLASLHVGAANMPMTSGGYIGAGAQYLLVGQLKPLGTTVILLAFFLSGITFLTGISWLALMEKIGRWSLIGLRYLNLRAVAWGRVTAERMKMPKELNVPRLMPPKRSKKPTIVRHTPSEPAIQEVPQPTKRASKVVAKIVEPIFARSDGDLAAPSLSLLDAVEQAKASGFSETELENLSRLVEARLEEFGIAVNVVAVHPGPVITRFELTLAPGLKVSRVTNLAKDLARSLSVVSVRVVEIIPGKPVIGLEIPNGDREIVRLKAVLQDASYQKANSPLTLGLGKDISGRPVTTDLAKMPHLLVAGTTGAGKSVALNAMLLSILYKSTPDDVRMILIDPKMLELAVYDNIPHLLTPVVTDMKEAANALRWCVNEMERRYQHMAALGVRHLAGYNAKIAEAAKRKEPIVDPLWTPRPGEEAPMLEHLPYIVVLVDEFADMMMVVGKKVEELIARIAQKARAAGIHLILATQRPSVDVITGLIKANVPTRIAFQVSSKIDSRTILDQSGAEQLLGNGDMLYLPPGSGLPTRVHGAYVADEEVHKVVNEWRKRGKPQYIDAVVTTNQIASKMTMDDQEEDELYDKAIFIVTESRRPSISHVQRRLKIGYNRAARLIERMEVEGIVSPVQSNGSREVIAPPPIEM